MWPDLPLAIKASCPLQSEKKANPAVREEEAGHPGPWGHDSQISHNSTGGPLAAPRCLQGEDRAVQRGVPRDPQYAVTFWLWACRASCSSAVDRAGPLSSGMAGGAPRRPGGEARSWMVVLARHPLVPTTLNIASRLLGGRKPRL